MKTPTIKPYDNVATCFILEAALKLHNLLQPFLIDEDLKIEMVQKYFGAQFEIKTLQEGSMQSEGKWFDKNSLTNLKVWLDFLNIELKN